MTTNQIRNRLLLFAFGFIIQVNAPSALAMKYQTFTLPALVEKAEVIVDCTVTQTEPTIRVSVHSAFKGEAKGEVEIVDQNIWLQDRPPLALNQRAILFLESTKGKNFQFAALGRQVLWPKRELQWPFTEGCIATHEETALVISTLVKISAQKAEREALVRSLLKSTNSLGRLQGIEVWRNLEADERHALLDDVRTLDSVSSSDEVKKAAATALSKLAPPISLPKDAEPSQKSK